MAQHTARKNTSIVLATFILPVLLAFPILSSAIERFETPVNFNVTPTGAANVSIPIEVPPGTAGMVPNLSLNYSSQGGDGILGVGWSLGGLSTIYRCGRTLIQDGVKDTVNYNSNDRYCMDGQRLVNVSGAYGANGTEYRTERESFTKIISYGAAGSGPAYFVAWTKAGQILEFGNTPDSRIEVAPWVNTGAARADVRVWAVNKIMDAVGNYLTITYTEDNANGDYRPARIDYTGNPNSPVVLPYNSVRFVYPVANRANITPLYQAGSVIKTMKLLANVKTYAKVSGVDTLVKDYRLGYNTNTATQRSLLTTLTECSEDEPCLPTTAGWESGGMGFTLPNYSSPALANALPTGQLTRNTNGIYMQTGDFNGDGKTDYMWLPENTDRWLIAYSTGTGFTLPNYSSPALPNALPTGQLTRNTNGIYMQTGDFNGDGKTDFMWLPQNTDRWLIAYSTGTGFILPDYNNPALPNALPTGQLTRNTNGIYMRTGDYNGDGKIDFMWLPENTDRWLIAYSNDLAKQPDTLITLTTGLGSTTTLAYKPLTDNSVYTKGTGTVYPYVDVQAPMYVVSSVTVPNGIGGTRVTNYKYSEAKSHLTGGGFLGFKQFDATDVSTGIKTSTLFRQDYPYHALPTSTTQTQSNGNLLKKVTNTWGFTTYADTVLPIATATGSKHHFAAILTSVEETYGLGGISELLTRVTTNNSGFDTYGNVSTVTTTTHDNHTKTITNTYSNDAVKWILGRVTRASVTSTLPNGSSLTRTSAFSYNTNNGLLLTETIEPDNASLRLDTAYTYDDFGNKKTATVSGAGITTRSTSTTYDAQGRFPVSAANALGHTETRVFDAKFGNITQVTGPNGLASNFAFDVWGRPTTESGPDGVVTTTTRGLCLASGCPALAAYYVSVSKPGKPTVTSYFDKFNRELRTSNTGFNGQSVYKDTEYDHKGRMTRVSRPYYAGNTAYWTNYSYDLLNRVITETDAQGKVSYFDYYGLTTTTTNPLGQKRTSVKNTQGQLVSVTDALNSTINYTYDPFGNLLTTTDPAGNVTRLTYDLRGRKTGMNDPDMGIWSYTYNVLGELLTQTDAKGQVTTNTYDKLGRMTQRTEPDLTTTWTYDTATKGIGKLASTTTDNGQTRTFSYDTLGRLNNTSTTIGSTTLAVTTTYDTLGRPDTQTNPAGVQVQNIYNANGHLSQIRNAQTLQVYWTANALSADGQLTDGTFGNGVVEGRTIDTLGRTTAVTATHTLGTVTLLNYTYDALGNLKTRTDTAQNLTENFGYDALNRLISISSSNPNQPAKTISYDAIGNITNKSDTGAYTYAALRANGTNRPHAASSVAGSWNTSFDYDANGNMISGGDRTYTYTSFNLPDTITRTITIEGVPTTKTTRLMYGADHERVKEIDDDGTITLSLNPRLDSGAHYDQRIHPGGVVEKISFLYAAARPIGIYTTNAHGQAGLDTLRYIHVDAQGSIVALSEGIVTQSTTQIAVERMSYDAWGKRRNIDGTDDTTHNLQANNTDHGYTGHMHLEDVGLIHMNGRVYDPRLGRFLQADPHIQSPGDLQSYNRYAYVLNNPFLYTDPSGYLSLKDVVKIVVVVVVAYYTGGAVSGSAWASCTASGATYGGIAAGAAAGAAGGAAMGALYGGTLESTLKGAVIGAVSGAIGGAVGGGTFGRMVGGGVNGYAQTGTTEGFLRGMAAGAIPENLWIDAYYNYGAANLAIGVVRDGIKGMVVADRRDGFVQGVKIGQLNNAIGHLVGIATTRSLPTFQNGDGVFAYKGDYWNKRGALTVGNVISGPSDLMTKDYNGVSLYAHELDHVQNPSEQSLGVAYGPVHVLDLAIGNTGKYFDQGNSWFMFEEHIQRYPYSSMGL